MNVIRAWGPLWVGLAGCYATASSSSAHLQLDESTAVVGDRVNATAANIVRLFAMRSITVTDEHPVEPSGSVLIRLVGARGHLGGEGGFGERQAIGSVYYVRVEPTARGAQLAMIGKPTIDGAEPCTSDPGFQLACSEVSVPESFSDDVTGYEEAQVIRGVLVQLRLEAQAASPNGH